MHTESDIRYSHIRLVRAIREHGKADEWESILKLISWEKVELLVGYSLDDSGKVSYAQTPAHRFDSAKRTKTKFGRFLTRRLKVEISPQMHAEIGKIMGEDSYTDTDFEIRENVATVYAELRRNHCVTSCMDGNPNDCLDFYSDNGIPALVWKGKARALLFTLNDGSRFVDRVYPADPDTIAAYERWASLNAASIRLHHGLDDGGSPMLPSRVEGSYVQIQSHEGGLPYLDTFAYIDTTKNRLHYEYRCGLSELKETEGQDIYGSSENTECAECSEYFDYDSSGRRIDGDYFCDSCAESAYFCQNCGHTSFEGFQCIDDGYYCETCSEEANYCERCTESTFKDTQVVGEANWCEGCTEAYAFECEHCQELHDDGESCTMVNGVEWCDECYDATGSDKCLACFEHIPYGLPVYSPTYDTNVCADCNADHSFSTVRPKRVHGGTAIVLERI